MRSRRLSFIFLAFYLMFIGGSAYYVLVFPIRFFHHALMTVLIGLWLFGRIRNQRGIPYTPLNTGIFALIAVWFISAIFSLDPRMSLENIWFLIVHVVIFFVLVDLFQHGRQKLVMEAQFLMGAVVIFITTLELASWYLGLGLVPGTDVGWISVSPIPLTLPRVSLAMNISTLLAGFVAPLITLAIGWALTVRRKDYSQVLWITAALLIGILILTFSRGGLISLAVALGSLTVMRFSQQRTGVSPQLILLGGAAIAIVAITGLMLLTLSGNRDSGDAGRVDMYRSAIEITADYPVIGVGVGQYGRAFRSYRDPNIARDKLASAHNYYLNIAAEIGVIGVIINLGLGVILLRTWWQRWQQAENDGRKLRLEAVYAALLGVAAHSLVDVFTTTPVVIVILVALAYSVVGHRTVLDTPLQGNRVAAAVLLVITVGYGIFFFQIDRAQWHYQISLLRNGDEALAEAERAANLDPSLNLYQLHITHLIGENAQSTEEITAAIVAYETALDLEPTWNIGWMNLAALEERRGNIDRAIAALENVYASDHFTQASLHLARLMEQSTNNENTEEAQSLYVDGIHAQLSARNYLPCALSWTETPLRRAALDTYTMDRRIDIQYRILQCQNLDEAAEIVPESPQSAAEWWVVGEHALTTENALENAIIAFTNAINLAPTNGDYYVSRARAHLISGDESAARSDVNLALLLRTFYEYPNWIRAELTDDPLLRQQYLAAALPPRTVPQEFAAVLFGGRFANFDLPEEMRFPGPGHEFMQPWYTLAEIYINQNQIEDAIDVYQSILDYAPQETQAAELLANLRE